MSATRRPRRSPDGGYARGDETRRRIIEAAIALFGQHGFDGASTRDIAARAGVNAPALQYYFENKEGVYRACAETFAEEAWRALEPSVMRGREALKRNADTAALIDAFIGIQEAVADRIFMKRHTTDQHLFFAREQAGSEPAIATQILMKQVRMPLNEVCAQLLERITGLAADNPQTLVRMFSLHGQLVMFHVAQSTTLTMLGWDDMDENKTEFIKANMRAQSRVLLEHWSRERDARKRARANRPPAVKRVAVKAAPAKRVPAKRAKAAKVAKRTAA
ncbi:CerR family C-terminal domain-containing protein [Paraburkholderia caballeronis]|uniref:CerR family C-terminal domain-containing protein n=1 Tax=Paraburkholderia caballeronis TaxID=416943 RepID=UPI001066CD3C|nr:CerR family C-terminal domain-containing protein [Paraburkholderia caballeronis]TDV13960.1 TetR family transcriptional regulator [Paraburkholderia caballeronis]TDV15473.1 TetR family transcriptional regulator [Paraburkholderia caballeronis]TDV24941.1 TetR family transcriptional regulator [Paraburkholderia caballeronis]